MLFWKDFFFICIPPLAQLIYKGRPAIKKRVKRGHLLPEKARRSRQIHFCIKTAYVWGLGYHWDPSPFTIVDYQSQILHIKPPFLQVCRQIWHFVVNLSVCIVHFQVIWGPRKFGLKKVLGMTPLPPRVTLSSFYPFFLMRGSPKFKLQKFP